MAGNVCLFPNVRVSYISQEHHWGTSSPQGIGRTVVGDMRAIRFFLRTAMLAMVVALVIIFLRGDLMMEAEGEGTEPPVADAGPDQRVNGPAGVQFDGTGSTDDVAITGYVWEFTYEDAEVQLDGPIPEFLFRVHGVYQVLLTVTDSNNSTDTDSMNVTVVTVPGEVPRVMVIGRNNWVEIAWDEPVHDGGSPVLGCVVFRGTTEDSLTPYYSDWWIRYWSWDYLAVNGITYYYAVAAINEVGMGPMSLVVNATPLAVPDSPQNLSIEEVNGAVHLAWDEPLWTDGRVEVTGYQVHRGTDPDWLYDTFEVGMNTTFVDEDVEEGVTYYYVVGADSSFGGSSVTEVVNVTVGGAQDGTEQPQTWELVLSFSIVIGLAGAMYYVFKMERKIGKDEEA